MKKIIIYQLFNRIYANDNENRVVNGTIAENGCGKFNDIRTTKIKHIKALSATHVWLTGIIRHATTTSYKQYGIPDSCSNIVKGKAGSPYAITDYYDVDPDLATDVNHRMEEFEALLTRIHKCGLKVIIDFVPNHVARQYHSIMKPANVHDLGEDDDTNVNFSTSNNFYYCTGEEFNPNFDKGLYHEYPARATGNDKFDAHPGKDDWYETVKLNYGVDYCAADGRSEHFDPIPDTWFKMRDILMFWADKDIEGVRCDMAEMVPAEFWKWVTAEIKKKHPGFLFIGEVYNPSLYKKYIESGFDYLYDKVGMYDCMRNIICGNAPATEITRQWQSTDDIKDHMLYFLENHDEQRIASDFFAGNAQKGIPAIIVNVLMGTNPFMIYNGQEFGEKGMDSEGFSGCDGRTSIFDYWSPKKLHDGFFDILKLSYQDTHIYGRYHNILKFAQESSAVQNGCFFDLMYANLDNKDFDKDHIYAFIRKDENQTLIIVANFSDNEAKAGIIIPRFAFDFLHISEGRYEVKSYLTHKNKKIKVLKADEKFEVTIDANEGVALEMNLISE